MNDRRKEMILALMNDELYKPMKFKELCALLEVPKAMREEFKEMLDTMISAGQISLNSKGAYKIPEPDTFTGTFCSSARGFGFVTIEGRKDDIFIPPDEINGAFHGDKVEVKIVHESQGQDSRRRAEGLIVRIVERGSKEIVAVYQKSKYFGFAVPENQKIGKDIFIPKGKNQDASHGSRVVVKITNYGSAKRNPEGEIIAVLGKAQDPQTDLAAIMKTYDLPEEFPEDVLKMADQCPDHVIEDQLSGRKDLRNLMTVTIDGEDAKDLDDAITLSKSGQHYILGVHIADVSNYVTEGSALDKEALKRGTSVYLINTVIPMLPRKLSNGICSLNEGLDRLTLSCIMEIDENGRIIGHEICESVINVNHRMSYTQVARLLEEPDAYEGKFADAVDMFFMMKELSDKLREKRRERGGIDFDFPEAKIILDEKDEPVDIHPYEINCANKIIEDFMLMANETVAQDYFWQELPFVYRCHESPDPDRIHRLYMLIRNYGYYIKSKKDTVHPKELQKLLGKIEGSAEETFISRLVLRSMKQARYSTENLGHFGLAVSYYCHFTSPIRRYPDLQIHRIIKENIHGNLDENRQNHYNIILDDVATKSSLAERKADEAERELTKAKKVEYMEKHIGESFDGLISGITSWGMYVELPDTCEGLVRLEALDDYYVYDENECALVGMDYGNVYRMGDSVRIKVAGIDSAAKTVLFEIDYDDPENASENTSEKDLENDIAGDRKDFHEKNRIKARVRHAKAGRPKSGHKKDYQSGRKKYKD